MDGVGNIKVPFLQTPVIIIFMLLTDSFVFVALDLYKSPFVKCSFAQQSFVKWYFCNTIYIYYFINMHNFREIRNTQIVNKFVERFLLNSAVQRSKISQSNAPTVVLSFHFIEKLGEG